MFKVISLLAKRPDLTREQFITHYETHHAPLIRSLFPHLTASEQQVLDLLARGCSNKEIGGQLFVSEDTVKYHLKNLYGKLGSRRRTEAILSASAAGLLQFRQYK